MTAGPPFRVDTAWQRATAIVSPGGDLDVATVRLLEREIDYALAEGDPSILAVDLRRVTFADARLLWLLLGYRAESRRSGYELVVVRGPHEVNRLFGLARVEDKFRFVDEPPDG
jgi:anti-anti-sigma factor